MKRFVTIAVVLALGRCGGWSANRSAVDTTAEARSFRLQLQGRGNRASRHNRINQPAKQQSLTPIPRFHPLKVPPIVSRIPPDSHLNRQRSAEKGSAVPLNWRPPHADLNAAGISAAEVSRLWETGVVDADARSERQGRLHLRPGNACPGLRSAARLRNRAPSLASISRASRRLAIPAVGRSRPFSPARASMKHLC